MKRDVLGRVGTDARRREALLDKFEPSGLSGPKFAALAGLCYQTFAGWFQKRSQLRGADPVRPLRDLAARPDAGLALVLPHGAGVVREAASGAPAGRRAGGDGDIYPSQS